MAKPRKLQKKLRQQEFYCVQCRKRVKCSAEDIRVKNDRAGNPRMVCKDTQGHKLFKYIKWADEKRLKKKFN